MDDDAPDAPAPETRPAGGLARRIPPRGFRSIWKYSPETTKERVRILRGEAEKPAGRRPHPGALGGKRAGVWKVLREYLEETLDPEWPWPIDALVRNFQVSLAAAALKVAKGSTQGAAQLLKVDPYDPVEWARWVALVEEVQARAAENARVVGAQRRGRERRREREREREEAEAEMRERNRGGEKP